MEEEKVKCPKCGAETPKYDGTKKTYACINPNCGVEFAKNKVFISYGHDNCKDLAFLFKDKLKDKGYDP